MIQDRRVLAIESLFLRASLFLARCPLDSEQSPFSLPNVRAGSLVWGFARVSWRPSRDLGAGEENGAEKSFRHSANRGSAAKILARNPKQVNLLAGFFLPSQARRVVREKLSTRRGRLRARARARRICCNLAERKLLFLFYFHFVDSL